jgi:basic amino acid/polyamine antiporter, APA family
LTFENCGRGYKTHRGKRRGDLLAEPKKTVFAREATGLVRDIGSLDAIIMVIGIILGLGWVTAFSAMWYLFPGVNTTITFMLIALLAIPNGIYYILITAVMPRSGGGGYLPLSRTISPLLGLGASFIFVTALIVNEGYTANWIVTLGVASPLSAYATVTSNSFLSGLATALNSQTWSFVIGTLVLFAMCLVAILGSRVILRLNLAVFIIGILGQLFMIGLLLSTSPSAFQSALDKLVGPGTYTGVISSATSQGWSWPSSWVLPTLLALPLAWFLTTGYAWSTYISGEIRKVSRTMWIAVVGGLLYFVVVFGLLAFLIPNAAGSNFVYAANYLANIGKSTLPFAITPTSIIALINTSPYFNFFLIVTLVTFGILIINAWYYIISRILLAWSFDRAVPTALGSVNERFHSPVWAVIATGVFAWLALVFYTFLPSIAGVVNLTYIYIFGLIFDGLAGIALPLRYKSMFAQAPPLARKKLGGIPWISILGVYSVIFLAALLGLALYNPAIAGPLGYQTAAIIVGVFVIAMGIYYAMKSHNKSLGLDLNMVFQQIPPE